VGRKGERVFGLAFARMDEAGMLEVMGMGWPSARGELAGFRRVDIVSENS
jgi:hypothetical protein